MLNLTSTISATPGHPWPIDRVDPRLRIVVAAASSILVAVTDRFAVLGIAAAAVLLGWALSGLSPAVVFKRLLPLNLLMLALIALLPLTTPGTPVFALGPLDFSREGFRLGALIAMKGNAIVLALLVLLGKLDAVTLGHAMNHLRMPDKLTHLLLFTVRYLDVLHHEYLRLRAAMKMRGFRPRMNRHTYRSFGYLVGMLLISSFDRSERIVSAMKCRGFRGRFYLLDHFHFSPLDMPFAVASAAILLAILWVQWT